MATMMRPKLRSFSVTIATVVTVIPLVTGIKKSGEENETAEVKTFDGSAHPLQVPTGYVKNPKYAVSFFYDAANAVHAFLKTSMRAAAAAGVVCKDTYTDAGPVAETWTVTGFGFDEDVDPKDGQKATANFQTSGEPS